MRVYRSRARAIQMRDLQQYFLYFFFFCMTTTRQWNFLNISIFAYTYMEHALRNFVQKREYLFCSASNNNIYPINLWERLFLIIFFLGKLISSRPTPQPWRCINIHFCFIFIFISYDSLSLARISNKINLNQGMFVRHFFALKKNEPIYQSQPRYC